MFFSIGLAGGIVFLIVLISAILHRSSFGVIKCTWGISRIILKLATAGVLYVAARLSFLCYTANCSRKNADFL